MQMIRWYSESEKTISAQHGAHARTKIITCLARTKLKIKPNFEDNLESHNFMSGSNKFIVDIKKII